MMGKQTSHAFFWLRARGGLVLSVYHPQSSKAKTQAVWLLAESRIHQLAPADYSLGKHLDTIVMAKIKCIAKSGWPLSPNDQVAL